MVIDNHSADYANRSGSGSNGVMGESVQNKVSAKVSGKVYSADELNSMGGVMVWREAVGYGEAIQSAQHRYHAENNDSISLEAS